MKRRALRRRARDRRADHVPGARRRREQALDEAERPLPPAAARAVLVQVPSVLEKIKENHV